NLILGATNAVGTGAISFNGGVLYLAADNTLNGNAISATEGNVIKLGVEKDGNYILGNANLSSVAFTKVGEGTLVLKPTANFTKDITIESGVLEINKSADTSLANIEGTLKGAGTLLVSGTNKLIIEHNNALSNFTGTIEVRGGILNFKNNTGGTAGANTILLKSGTILQMDWQEGTMSSNLICEGAVTLHLEGGGGSFKTDFTGSITLASA
ncbi:MAG: hypothetical protein RRY13_09000, partial [Akkermansia sp.]